MITLLRHSLSWISRHFLIFALIVIALIASAKAYEAYRAVPALNQEVAALEEQRAALESETARQLTEVRASAERIGEMEASFLQRRLAEVRAQIAASDARRYSRSGFAIDVMRGDTDAIARELTAGFRLELLQHEERAILARLTMDARGNRVQGLSEYISRLDVRAAALERQIDNIERQYPILSRAETVPMLRNVQGPWRELSQARQQLRVVNTRRQRAAEAQRIARTNLDAAQAAYERGRRQMVSAVPPGAELQREIARKRDELSRHWTSRAWSAVKPVLGGALWIMFLVIAVPPATKALWFFGIAPIAAKLRPIVIRPDLGGDVKWEAARPEDEPLPTGSAVSRRLTLHPGDELIVKPSYLQSSMNEAQIDSTAVLSWAIPLGSLATGLIGLTRIRVHKPEVATLAASQDLFDEIGIIHIAEGSGLVFKPRNLIGVIQRTDCPLRIHSVWRLGHLSAWLTLQLRFLVFEGPCSLVVRGARGVALEPSRSGRRISGSATLGWTAGLAYSVRRSETFLAYFLGQQSLFNDSFDGEDGRIIYEQVPRGSPAGGRLGRGLEGLGDGLLKVVGL
jgi:hypothetical protein